nr:hypothetical protein GCM10025732_45420 [Glycomyces mayteni]
MRVLLLVQERQAEVGERDRDELHAEVIGGPGEGVLQPPGDRGPEGPGPGAGGDDEDAEFSR